MRALMVEGLRPMRHYDFFSYFHDLAARKMSNGKHTADVANKLYQSKFHELKNMSRTLEMTIEEPVNSGMSWQISEVFAQLFRENANYADESRISKKVKNKILKKARDAKPVWSGDLGRRPADMQKLVGDEHEMRVREAQSMPPLCFRLEIIAPITTPIVIKGDRPFVAHENPFSTDKTTGMPMIRPSSLKGQFRKAMLSVCKGRNDEPQVVALCGDANDEEESGRKSRVEFLPCYINKNITYDIIAPHDEENRRIHPGPVTLEVVEPPLELSIWLQYWPIDLLSRWSRSSHLNPDDLVFDLIYYCVAATASWMGSSGIGSKTGTGYGQVEYESTILKLYSSAESPWNELWDRDGEKIQKIIEKGRQEKLRTEFLKRWGKFVRNKNYSTK